MSCIPLRKHTVKLERNLNIIEAFVSEVVTLYLFGRSMDVVYCGVVNCLPSWYVVAGALRRRTVMSLLHSP